jgi:7-cyano-7-deazaguanine tRNA-ribosyltransferase
MQIVAGLSLKNLKPRVWDPSSLYYLPTLTAVMVSYAEFHQKPRHKHEAMKYGLRAYLGVSENIRIYLDNGAFFFLGRTGEIPREEYEAFVAQARPDWYPIPQDFIPTPKMTREEQRACFDRTMEANLAYQHDGYVPVIHICQFLTQYTIAVKGHDRLSVKPIIALGGIVPNLLRAPNALPYARILESLAEVRQTFSDKSIHVFGIGGTATLHLAALLRMDSLDSSGWRNRAARGIVQLPGRGDRMVANMGSWRGREPSEEEWAMLRACLCPACQQYGIEGLKVAGIEGFCNRATHNLATLLNEARWIEEHLSQGTYVEWYKDHLDNSIYRPLIDQAIKISPRLSLPHCE